MILAKEPCDRTLSTAMEFSNPHLLKAAVTPAVPEKSSKMITSCSVKPSKGAPSQFVLPASFGISLACATLNAWVLKQLALKQTWRPLLQTPPTGASGHSPKLKLKQMARPFESRPTAPVIPLGATLEPCWFLDLPFPLRPELPDLPL